MSNSDKRFVPLVSGMKWPGGSYIEVARLAITEAHLHDYFGRDLLKGDEPGLGAWRAIGMQLSSGAFAELISYDAEDQLGFTLRVDVLADPRSALDEVVLHLLPSAQGVIWQSPLIEPR